MVRGRGDCQPVGISPVIPKLCANTVLSEVKLGIPRWTYLFKARTQFTTDGYIAIIYYYIHTQRGMVRFF